MLIYSRFRISSLKRNFFIARNHKGVCEISFSRNEERFVFMLKRKYGLCARRTSSKLKKEVVQIQEYFKGKRREFTFPLFLSGSNFQKRIWSEISKIPYGKTVSYSKIAQRIKNRNAVRAVGNACGKNPVPIIIPCHRVIAKDGSLGGFGGGLTLKSKLLELEMLNN